MTRSLLLLAAIATPVSLAQDIAPKDSERDPVVSALTEGLGEGPIESGITATPPLMTGEDGAPVLVTGTPPEGAEIEKFAVSILDPSSITFSPPSSMFRKEALTFLYVAPNRSSSRTRCSSAARRG